VLKISKVPLQISFDYSKPFLAFLVNFWPITLFKCNSWGYFLQEKSLNLENKDQ
jgi:hypothetical protein